MYSIITLPDDRMDNTGFNTGIPVLQLLNTEIPVLGCMPGIACPSTNHSKPSPYTLPVSLTSSQSSMSTAHLIPPNIPNHSLPFSKKSLHFSLWLAPTPTLSSQATSISTATTHLIRKRFSFSPHCLTSTSSNMSPSLLIPAAIHSTFLSLGTAPHLHPSLASLQLHPTILHFSLSSIYPLLHFILQSLGHSDASTQSIFRTSSLTFLPLSS